MAFETGNILQELMRNPALAMLLKSGNIMNYLNDSPEGKQLMELLERDGGGSMQAAAEAANRGDLSGVLQLVTALMKNPEAAELLNKISQDMNGNNNRQ